MSKINNYFPKPPHFEFRTTREMFNEGFFLINKEGVILDAGIHLQHKPRRWENGKRTITKKAYIKIYGIPQFLF